MVRTIEVVFIPCGNRQPISNKSYFFLCTYDEVKIGDRIIDSRYSNPMQVINISHWSDRVQRGFILKDIIIDSLNGKKIVKSDNDTRTLSITIKQAREWYASNNRELKTLALSLYTQEELELNYRSIASKVYREGIALSLPTEDTNKFVTTAKLATIAKYFNKSWKRTTDNTGYFIVGDSTYNPLYKEVTEGVSVYKHSTVVYPGIIYFKTEEDAIKAIKILGDEVKNLF